MGTELSLQQIAATRAAVDPQRKAWRRDILVSAIVETLATSPGVRSSELTRVVNAAWRTRSIAADLVDDALRTAHRAGLVVSTKEVDGEVWTLTDSARLEVEQDRAWAELILTNFRKELAERLRDAMGDSFKEQRVPRLADQLIAAVAVGCSGTLEVVAATSRPDLLRPVQFDVRAAMRAIRKSVQPRPVAVAMADLWLLMLDPEEDFGDEVLSLMLVGSILHGLLIRRDVKGTSCVEDARLILDTSTLLYLVTGQRPVIERLIQESKACGAIPEVPEHVVAEWDGLWEAAEAELAGRADSEWQMVARGEVLVRNPLLRAYLVALREDPQLTWARFKLGKRNVQSVLNGLGVKITRHKTFSNDENVLLERVYARLLELSRNPNITARRSEPAAWTDAQTCVMIRGIRKRTLPSGLPSAWFIAGDTLTGRVYKEGARRDSFPLAVTPETWLLFLSSQRSADADELRDLALTLTAATKQRAFFSVATGYTAKDALSVSRFLSENEVVAREDVRGMVLLDFMSSMSDDDRSVKDDSGHVALQRAMQVVRARSGRRDARARRESKRAEAREAEAQAQVRQAQARAEAEVAIAAKTVSEAQQERSQLADQMNLLKRRISVVGTAVGLFGLAGSLYVIGVLGLIAYAVTGVLLSGALAASLPYLCDTSVKVHKVASSFVGAMVWFAASLIWSYL